MSTVTTVAAQLVESETVRKDFSTGSRGFHASGKITVDGVRYQVSGMAVLIGSKQDQSLTVDADLAEAATGLANTARDMTAKTFGSGKTGFYVQGKSTFAGQRYQVSAQAVRLA